MKDKQNIRTMIMPSVKNVTKKLIINWTMCKNCCNMKSDSNEKNLMGMEDIKNVIK